MVVGTTAVGASSLACPFFTAGTSKAACPHDKTRRLPEGAVLHVDRIQPRGVVVGKIHSNSEWLVWWSCGFGRTRPEDRLTRSLLGDASRPLRRITGNRPVLVVEQFDGDRSSVTHAADIE